jgi:hypothetical protein
MAGADDACAEAAASSPERCPEDGPPPRVAGTHPAARKAIRIAPAAVPAIALAVLGMAAVVLVKP